MPAIVKYNFKFERVPVWLKPVVAFLADKSLPVVKPLKMYNVKAANTIKQQVMIPVIVVGGIGALEDIENIIGSGHADLVSMSRPFIIEPDIVKKFKEGKQKTTRCKCCNYCLIGVEKEPLHCFYGKLKK